MENVIGKKANLQTMSQRLRNIKTQLEQDVTFQRYFKETNLKKKEIDLSGDEHVIKRIQIPIIGRISSGKSTFLNALLGIDCLEVRQDVTTQFCCLIRHNGELKEPKLFSIKPFESGEFEKDKLLCEGNRKIKIKIEELNKKTKELKEGYLKSKDIKIDNLDKFFYILESNIPLFSQNEDLEIYTDYFEFMDTPGLNEAQDFYIEHIIPIIKENVRFAIFIFDATKINTKDTNDIVRTINKKFGVKEDKLGIKYNHSLIICNKIDKIQDNQEHFFENEFKNSMKSLSFDLSKDECFAVNSVEFLSEVSSSFSFNHFLLNCLSKYKKKLNEITENFFVFAQSELEKYATNIPEYEPEAKNEKYNEILEEIINKATTYNNIQLLNRITILDVNDQIELLDLLDYTYNYVKPMFVKNQPELFTTFADYFKKSFGRLLVDTQNNFYLNLINDIVANITKKKKELIEEKLQYQHYLSAYTKFRDNLVYLVKKLDLRKDDGKVPREDAIIRIRDYINTFLKPEKANKYIKEDIELLGKIKKGNVDYCRDVLERRSINSKVFISDCKFILDKMDKLIDEIKTLKSKEIDIVTEYKPLEFIDKPILLSKDKIIELKSIVESYETLLLKIKVLQN